MRYVASFGHEGGTINGTGAPSKLELSSFLWVNLWRVTLGSAIHRDQPDDHLTTGRRLIAGAGRSLVARQGLCISVEPMQRGVRL